MRDGGTRARYFVQSDGARGGPPGATSSGRLPIEVPSGPRSTGFSNYVATLVYYRLTIQPVHPGQAIFSSSNTITP